jgi:hypothetical protein
MFRGTKILFTHLKLLQLLLQSTNKGIRVVNDQVSLGPFPTELKITFIRNMSCGKSLP